MFAYEIKELTKGHITFSKRTEQVKKENYWKAVNG